MFVSRRCVAVVSSTGQSTTMSPTSRDGQDAGEDETEAHDMTPDARRAACSLTSRACDVVPGSESYAAVRSGALGAVHTVLPWTGKTRTMLAYRTMLLFLENPRRLTSHLAYPSQRVDEEWALVTHLQQLLLPVPGSNGVLPLLLYHLPSPFVLPPA